MNNIRRRDIDKVYVQAEKMFEEAKKLWIELDRIRGEELTALENTPINLQNSEAYDKSEECYESLLEAVENMDSVETCLEWVLLQLSDAME